MALMGYTYRNEWIMAFNRKGKNAVKILLEITFTIFIE